MSKKKIKKNDELEKTVGIRDIPTINEESCSMGEIKINHTVIASIVKLAALEVPGVVMVAGGFVDELAGMFSKKDSGAGIRVEENENGQYEIMIRVILSFGIELARTAYEIQTSVRDQVSKMTNKDVAKVDVIIDGVKTPESTSVEEKKKWVEPEHTD